MDDKFDRVMNRCASKYVVNAVCMAMCRENRSQVAKLVNSHHVGGGIRVLAGDLYEAVAIAILRRGGKFLVPTRTRFDEFVLQSQSFNPKKACIHSDGTPVGQCIFCAAEDSQVQQFVMLVEVPEFEWSEQEFAWKQATIT